MLPTVGAAIAIRFSLAFTLVFNRWLLHFIQQEEGRVGTVDWTGDLLDQPVGSLPFRCHAVTLGKSFTNVVAFVKSYKLVPAEIGDALKPGR